MRGPTSTVILLRSIVSPSKLLRAQQEVAGEAFGVERHHVVAEQAVEQPLAHVGWQHPPRIGSGPRDVHEMREDDVGAALPDQFGDEIEVVIVQHHQRTAAALLYLASDGIGERLVDADVAVLECVTLAPADIRGVAEFIETVLDEPQQGIGDDAVEVVVRERIGLDEPNLEAAFGVGFGDLWLGRHRYVQAGVFVFARDDDVFVGAGRTDPHGVVELAREADQRRDQATGPPTGRAGRHPLRRRRPALDGTERRPVPRTPSDRLGAVLLADHLNLFLSQLSPTHGRLAPCPAPAKPKNGTIPVYLEAGKTRVFACSLDWPGWCRRAKTDEEALDVLAAYAPRYAMVAKRAGLRFPSAAPRGVRGRRTDSLGAVARRSPTSTLAQSGRRRSSTVSRSRLRRRSGLRHSSRRHGPNSTMSLRAPRRSCAKARAAAVGIATPCSPTSSQQKPPTRANSAVRKKGPQDGDEIAGVRAEILAALSGARAGSADLRQGLAAEVRGAPHRVARP